MEMRIPGGPAGAVPARGNSEAELKKACEDLESLFLKQLLTEMRRATGTTMHGPGGEVYQEMFDDELSRDLARTSDLGVARMVQAQLLRAGSGSPAPAKPADGTAPAGVKWPGV